MSISHRIVFALLMLFASVLTTPRIWALDASVSGDVRTGYTYFSIGDATTPTPKKPALGLMLMGGSDWPVPAFNWFVEKSGNGHIVILRASGGADLQQKLYEEIGKVASVQTLVFTSREAASDPIVLDIVRKADGIFIAGGDQSRYIRFWKGTPLNAVLDAHVRAGKPLGGTSAGLAIMGSSSYGALDNGSIVSVDALQRPLGPGVTIDSDFLHLPFLDNVITDSHFAKRDRLGRLIAFMAKASLRQDTAIVGLGVDEYTALCIDAAGVSRVFSGNGGYAWLVQARGKAEVTENDRPLTFRNLRVTGIGVGSRFDAKSFAIKKPAFESIADVIDGHLDLRQQ